MTKSILIILIALLTSSQVFSQLSKTEYESVVEYFVDCIKDSDIEKLDLIISYPYRRPYPIPAINNKQELKNRYFEVFDDSLTSIISNSSIKEDWKDVGWRGIMLHNGIVWLDYDGKLLSINYSSKREVEIEEKWIEYERNLLHSVLKDFKKPIHTIETDKFIVRIDLLENQKYRYVSWPKESKLSDIPDLVINNGERIPDGSGGNHYFTFKNGIYTYVLYVNNMRPEERAPFDLEVIKDETVILNQPAELKKIR
jgi:hypothetical protein